jgi:hypothetical protein
MTKNAQEMLFIALFNGRSKFGVLGSGTEPVKVGGIVCDDAHVAFSTIRDVFSVSITREGHQELYADLATRFRADFEQIGKIGSFDDIVEREDTEVLEVPYPAWLSKAEAVRQLLARKYDEDFSYQLPLLRNHFAACHALISARDFSITALQPLTHLLPTFADCRRRVYMSATIADDSSIVRTFDANPKTIKNPIIPESLAGIGERMILAPASTQLPIGDEQNLAQTLASKVAREAGVVILVPSEKAAKCSSHHGWPAQGSKYL